MPYRLIIAQKFMVKKSNIFITFMLSLFIFQSLWNVAAAFCVHETLSTHSTTLPHFGHHGAVRCEQNQTTKHTQMQALQEKCSHQVYLQQMIIVIICLHLHILY